MTEQALRGAEYALWVCIEHNTLHHGESHNTVLKAKEARQKVLEALSLPTQSVEGLPVSTREDFERLVRSHPIYCNVSLGRDSDGYYTDDAAEAMFYAWQAGVGKTRATAAAVLAEREACAKVCDNAKAKSRNHLFRSGLSVAAGEIRARGAA